MGLPWKLNNILNAIARIYIKWACVVGGETFLVITFILFQLMSVNVPIDILKPSIIHHTIVWLSVQSTIKNNPLGSYKYTPFQCCFYNNALMILKLLKISMKMLFQIMTTHWTPLACLLGSTKSECDFQGILICLSLLKMSFVLNLPVVTFL